MLLSPREEAGHLEKEQEEVVYRLFNLSYVCLLATVGLFTSHCPFGFLGTSFPKFTCFLPPPL